MIVIIINLFKKGLGDYTRKENRGKPQIPNQAKYNLLGHGIKHTINFFILILLPSRFLSLFAVLVFIIFKYFIYRCQAAFTICVILRGLISCFTLKKDMGKQAVGRKI